MAADISVTETDIRWREPGIWLRRDGNGLLLAAGLAYALLYLALWPRSWTSMDESCYLGMAWTLRHGTLYPDVAGWPVVTTFPVGPHMVSKYPLGMPLLLAGASLLGWKTALGVNLVVHLLTFAVVIRLLRRCAVPGVFALLFLLHPTAVLYSRTVMADPVSGLLLAFAFDRLLSRRPALCGALIGAAVLCRTGNALALPVFLTAFAWQRPRPWAALPFLAGASPFLGLAAYYSAVVAHGEMAAYTGSFALADFPRMFPGYVLGLLLLWPGMLLAPALFVGPGRAALAALCYGTVLLYSFWYYRDTGGTPWETLIVGQRYFLAVLPLFVVAYSAWLWLRLRGRPAPWRALLGTAFGLCLFAGAGLVSVRHARYLAPLAAARADLLRVVGPRDLLLCGTQAAKSLHPGWGRRSVVLLSGPLTPGDARRVSAAVRATRAGGGRIFAAAWVRPGRTGDAADARYLDGLRRRYVMRPLPLAASPDLPPGFTLIEIVAPPRSISLSRQTFHGRPKNARKITGVGTECALKKNDSKTATEGT